MTDILANLNPMQKKAVLHNEGPLLILAGAGSGKTRVLTHRIAYLIEEYGVAPYQILALTFTNKAANEMRERVDRIVSYGAESIWVSTFHSTCVRILRRFIDHLGYDRSFTIYDADDQKSLMKDICKHLNIDTKKYKEKTFLNAISSAKNELQTPDQYAAEVAKEYNKKIFGSVYREYQRRLQQNNALDFDDLIMKTVELFQKEPEVLRQYQERFRYLLVDEYQDTNTAQFTLLSLLASRYQNLCVVGDDDQSIYKFRGANIMNILNFEKVFPQAEVIRLEQNYRSTKRILEAANEVIRHNASRKAKTLWTDQEEGEPIRYVQFGNEYEEAAGIAGDIAEKVRNQGASYSDFAVLYRTNAQSRVFEEKLVQESIPYRIVGAINFYSRKEIKDILCYLKTINNPADDIAVKRIINVPKRGIGATTIQRITNYAIDNDMSFYEALTQADYIDGCGRAATKIFSFVTLIERLRHALDDDELTLTELMDEIFEATGYIKDLEAEETVEANARLENLDALVNKVAQYQTDCEEETSDEAASLNGLLENIALVADIDTVEDDAEQVLLMTIHSAKGLEFPNVYVCGMEENVFPSAMALYDLSDDEIEEERRLCYVAITRAMKNLTLTCAMQRMKNGQPNFNFPSRFISEIPRYLLKQTQGVDTRSRANSRPSIDRTATLDDIFSPAKIYSKGSKNPFAGNPYIQKGVKKPETNGTPDYGEGDSVYHIKFGNGIVRSLKPLDSDYEVVVDFDTMGQRKLRASFAKLLKIK